MNYGIYIHIKTSEDRSYAFKFKNPFNTDHPLPSELLIIKEIIIGYKFLGDDSVPKIKLFNEGTEQEILSEFYSFLCKLLNSDNKKTHFIIGYDLKRFILPSLIKAILLKYRIVQTYNELPEILKFKDTKPWDIYNLIDLKEELSFGAMHVPFEYVKHYLGDNSETIEDELNFIIYKLSI